MPRIALLFEYPTLNGGERSMLAVLDRLRVDRAEHFAFTAIAPERGPLAGALQIRGIEVLPLQIRDDADRRLPRDAAGANLRDAVRRCNADLVHANSLAMGRLLGSIANDVPIPCIAHLRDIINLSAAAIRDLNRNDRLIAVSNATREFHVAQGLDAAKTVVLYNGVDCDVFSPKPASRARQELRAKLGLRPEAFLVLTVGQIGLRKRQDVLAEAAVVLARSGETASGEMHYLVVGERNSNKTESVEFERNFARRFAEAGIADRLHLLGYRDDVARLMNAADLLVHPAHQEPLGRVLLEAAASGLPIVATDVGGTSEILTDGISARLVRPGDPIALAAAIGELANSVELRSRLATAARETIASRFTIAQAAAAHANLWLASSRRETARQNPTR